MRKSRNRKPIKVEYKISDIRYIDKVGGSTLNYVMNKPPDLDLSRPISVKINGQRATGIVFADSVSIEVKEPVRKIDKVILNYYEKAYDFSLGGIYTTCPLQVG